MWEVRHTRKGENNGKKYTETVLRKQGIVLAEI